MFLSSSLNYLREMKELVALLRIQEICQALCPCVFVLNEYLNEFLVIFELWIDNFYILFVFPQEVAEILEGLLNALR